MKTQFITMHDKYNLSLKLDKGDDKSIQFVLTEIDRLESIIRDYEAGIELIINKYTSDTLKQPAAFK